MATFILVHGGMHGGWCWEKIVPLLTQAGHVAIAPNLPGSQNGDVPPQDVSLAMTGGFVADLARAQAEPVVIVGHSLGGITISTAAEQAPEAVLGLVYLAAILLPPGEQAAANVKSTGKKSESIDVSEDGSVLNANPAFAGEVFYNGCDAADVARAVARFTPQPTRPMREPVQITAERYGSVPRAYIECLQDNAHPLPLQRTQHAAMPCDPVIAMDTGHSPFMQAPEELAGHLMAIAEAFAQRRAQATAAAQ